MKRFDVYEMVTNLIIERMEVGVVPWQMPWKTSGGMPRNLVSKKTYRGFNFWYLLSFGFENPSFLTFNQVKDLGGSIKKGSKSYQVVFWKMLDIENKPDDTGKVPMLRYYRIFHIDSVEGIDPSKIPSSETHDHDFNPIAACEEIVSQWEDSPEIEHGSHNACYIPLQDKVRMPNPRAFYKDEEYYSVLYHELSHNAASLIMPH